MPKSEQHTVFVLGAGFSKAAGLPSQAELLGKVLRGDGSKEIRDFIERVYGLVGEDAERLALEDVYTPIHRSVARNEWLKGHSPDELWALERTLTAGIADALNIDISEADSAGGFLSRFVGELADRATPGGGAAVISLNWDIVLDRRLHLEIARRAAGDRDGRKGVIDYCCHCTGLGNEDDRIIPGLLAKSERRPRVKLLKLHGSLNWLTCRQCHRLYVNKMEKIGRSEFSEPQTCRHCEKSGQGSPKLGASILLPTFQKNMGDHHIQQVWNQAGTEISRARKIVFIGYSFPLADFEFRTLVTKHLSPNASAEIVLHTRDEAHGPERRYRDYFGPNRCTIHYGGVETYVSQNTETFS